MKILALQLKRIGDLVLTAPALRTLKAAGAEVTIAVNIGTAALLPALLGVSVDEAIVHDGRLTTWRRLLRGGWDASVDFTGRDRSALMTLLAHAPRRRVAEAALRGRGKWRLAYNERVDSIVRERHTVDYYLDHVAALVKNNDPSLGQALRVPAKAVARADAILQAAGIGERDRFAVVHPGSARAEKYWVAERWVEVIRHLGRKCGLRAVLTGGSGDASEDAHLAEVRGALGTGDVDLTGRLDLLTLTATIARAALVLSVDTGPMHLAAAFERPQIALFGPTNPFHWRPRHPRAFVLQGGHGDAPMREFSPDSPGGQTAAISTCAVIDCIEQAL